MKTNRLGKTELIELVETHNLLLSFKRLQADRWGMKGWRQALCHALALAGVGNDLQKRIREALELP